MKYYYWVHYDVGNGGCSIFRTDSPTMKDRKVEEYLTIYNTWCGWNEWKRVKNFREGCRIIKKLMGKNVKVKMFNLDTL